MLSERQRREFHRNGFLVVESGVDRGVVDRAREALWEEIEATPDTWEERNTSVYSDEFDTGKPFGAINDRLSEYCEALVGEGNLGYEGDRSAQIAIRFPRKEGLTDPEAPQLSDVTSHIDGMLDVEDGEGEVVPHTVNGVAYLDRVQPYGGGFTAWPGSHRDVCRYLEDHPVQAMKHGIPAPDGEGGWREGVKRDEVFDPLELTGDPGTVILWHGRLEHEGGINLRPGDPRIAHIKRFFHESAGRFQEEAPEEPYLGWSGMAGLVEADGYRV